MILQYWRGEEEARNLFDNAYEPELPETSLSLVDDNDDGGEEELEESGCFADEEQESETSSTTSCEVGFKDPLVSYFRELPPATAMSPDEQAEAARDIERWEYVTWTKILDHAVGRAATYSVVMEAKRTKSLEPERRRLLEIAQNLINLLKKPEHPLGEATQNNLSAQLRSIDVDQKLVDRVLVRIKEQAQSSKGQREHQALYDMLRESSRGRKNAIEAKNRFVQANLRLVVSIAKRFTYGRMPLIDRIQEGNIGLIKAVERFDYRMGNRFSTYASYWIRQSIARAIADKGRLVRLPVHLVNSYGKVRKTARQLTNKLGRLPTTEELSERVGLPKEKVESLRQYMVHHSCSIDNTIKEGDTRCFSDLLQDEQTPLPEEQVLSENVSQNLHEMLASLTPVEENILKLRFGLDGEDDHTLEEIGRQYSLSRERIRQIQAQGLNKMRRQWERREV